ncbi:hypothetical protein B0H10DRAFT_1945618 [Mycena sp. CBHHK59/15]|nr:hypothetical protein B0H10DRAFT_1945618 [Mycena sp. CBHHK59/15]
MTPPLPAVVSGNVRLLILPERGFYLEIPIDVVVSLCLKPVKYLRFLGWCILGVLGDLTFLGGEIEDNTLLVDQGIYTYVIDDDQGPQFSDLRSGSTSHEDPQHSLNKDHNLMKLISESRPNGGERSVAIESINDICHGLLLAASAHLSFKARKLVILKTPNDVLTTADIPPCPDRVLPGEVSYPVEQRYTFQWILSTPLHLHQIPNNTDAAFLSSTQKTKPSPLLLHYNYGVAAVNWWGHGDPNRRKI